MKVVEFVQDALIESYSIDFDIVVIQDLLRKALLELYESVDSTERQALLERYQAAFDDLQERNAKLDRFMEPEEVEALRNQLDEIPTKARRERYLRSLAELDAFLSAQTGTVGGASKH